MEPARGALLVQMSGDRIRCAMEIAVRVVVAPATAEQDQRRDRAVDEQRGRAAIVAVARINGTVRIIRTGDRIFSWIIPRWRISRLAITRGWIPGLPIAARRRSRLGIACRPRSLFVTASERQQQGCHHKTTTHPQSPRIIVIWKA
jgi:hypothetical protein